MRKKKYSFFIIISLHLGLVAQSEAESSSPNVLTPEIVYLDDDLLASSPMIASSQALAEGTTPSSSSSHTATASPPNPTADSTLSPPSEPKPPTPSGKRPVFNTGFLRGTGASGIDLNELLNSGVLPGEYEVTLVINGSTAFNRLLSFEKNPRTSLVEACISLELLDKLGVDIVKLTEQAKQANQDLSGCLDLPEIVDKASQTYDSGRFRLSISMPQVFLREEVGTFADPSLWDYGVTALMTQYSLSANRSWNHDTSSSTYSMSTSLRNRANMLGWRLHNTGSLTKRQNDRMRYSSFTLYAEHDVDFLKAQFRVGDVYASARGLDGVGVRGVQLTDDLSMQPGVEQFLQPAVRGLADTSAIVEIRQRGFLIHTVNVPPGAFEITEIPNVSSDGDLEITVIEADGRRLVTIQPWMSSVNIVKPGFFTYEASLGKYNNYGSSTGQDFNVGSFNYQYGLTRYLTVEGGVLATENYLANSVGLATLTPIGPVSFDVKHAMSHNVNNDSAAAVGVTYSKYFSDYHLSVGLATHRYLSEGFRSLSEHIRLSEPDAPDLMPGSTVKQTSSISVSKTMADPKWGSFYGSLADSRSWGDTGKISSLSIGYRNTYKNISFGMTGSYTKNVATQDQGTINARQLVFTVGIPLGSSDYPIRVDASYSTRGGFDSNQAISKSGNFRVNQQVINYTGYMNGSYDRFGSVGGNLSTVTSTASYYGSLTTGRSFTNFNYGMSGGIVLHGGGVNFTRNATDSLILVKLPGQRGVDVRGSTTGYNGYAVVNASPYQFNQVLVGRNLDPDVDLVQDMGLNVVPRRDAIVAANFDIITGRRIEFTLSTPDGSRLPFGAIVSDHEGKRLGLTDPFGKALVLLTSDSGKIMVKWDKQQCEFEYQLKAPDPALNFEKIAVTCHPITKGN